MNLDTALYKTKKDVFYFVFCFFSEWRIDVTTEEDAKEFWMLNAYDSYAKECGELEEA